MKLWFRRFATFLCKIVCNCWFRIEVLGRENIPKHGAFVIISNHRSYFDPVLVGISTKRSLSYMAKEELFENKAFGFLLRNLGVFPVNRQSGGSSAMTYATDLLQEGSPLVLFPEGTRSKSRRLLPFKAGVVLIARKADAPMIPCAVSIPLGNPFRGKVTVQFGSPVHYHQLFEEIPSQVDACEDGSSPAKPKATLKYAATILRNQVISLLPPGDHPNEGVAVPVEDAP